MSLRRKWGQRAENGRWGGGGRKLKTHPEWIKNSHKRHSAEYEAFNKELNGTGGWKTSFWRDEKKEGNVERKTSWRLIGDFFYPQATPSKNPMEYREPSDMQKRYKNRIESNHNSGGAIEVLKVLRRYRTYHRFYSR